MGTSAIEITRLLAAWGKGDKAALDGEAIRVTFEKALEAIAPRKGRMNASDQHRLVLLQGDRRRAGDSSDGVVARRQVAQVFAHSLNSSEALRKIFELIGFGDRNRTATKLSNCSGKM